MLVKFRHTRFFFYYFITFDLLNNSKVIDINISVGNKNHRK